MKKIGHKTCQNAQICYERVDMWEDSVRSWKSYSALNVRRLPKRWYVMDFTHFYGFTNDLYMFN